MLCYSKNSFSYPYFVSIIFLRKGYKNMINKVILVGNLGADPESRTMASGTEVVNFRMSTSQSCTDKITPQKVEKTEWHSVVIFNPQLAKVALQHLSKGSAVYIEGQLQTCKWQDESGQERYTTEIVLSQYKGELKILNSIQKDDIDVDTQEQAITLESVGRESLNATFNDDVLLQSEDLLMKRCKKRGRPK